VVAYEYLQRSDRTLEEESTYRSYARYVRLHVVPYIGSIPLQQLTPMDRTR
jgi:Phage integrase, N-terminal SAM-like domain